MFYKHNKRNWKYRALAMLAGYQFRVRAFHVPAPLCNPTDTPSNRPDDPLIGAVGFGPLFVGGLIYSDPSHVTECAACGMDASMQHGLELCSNCHKCLHWEDEFGAGSCCTCGNVSPLPTDLDPQSVVMAVLS